jgi:hypothetical protein
MDSKLVDSTGRGDQKPQPERAVLRIVVAGWTERAVLRVMVASQTGGFCQSGEG